MTCEDDHTAYFAAVRAKLAKGQQLYGDASYQRSHADLLRELQEEAVDLAGWGCILWERIQGLLDRIEGS